MGGMGGSWRGRGSAAQGARRCFGMWGSMVHGAVPPLNLLCRKPAFTGFVAYGTV